MKYNKNEYRLKDVKEYCEEYDPTIVFFKHTICIKGINEAGYNSTEIDLIQLLNFLEKHKILTLHKDYEERIRAFTP